MELRPRSSGFEKSLGSAVIASQGFDEFPVSRKEVGFNSLMYLAQSYNFPIKVRPQSATSSRSGVLKSDQCGEAADAR